MAETASQSADSSARIGLHFNGASGSYITLPKEILAGRTAFSVSMDFATTQNTGSSRVYNRPCLIGIDTSGYTSGDWHIDTKNGNLHLFDGMGVSGSYGSSVTWNNGDIGYDTGVKVNDGKKHNVKLVDDGAKFTIFVDGKECEEHPTVSKNCDEKNGITIACSRPGECVYSEMTLYDLVFYDEAGAEIAKYEPTQDSYGDGIFFDSVGGHSVFFDKSKIAASAVIVTKPIYQTYGITPCDDKTKTSTGYAFHYASRIKRFHIPEDVKEIWVRFDIWRATNASRWRAFNQSSDECNGVTYEDNAIHFWSSADKDHTIKSVSGTDEELTGLHSYVLHMKCGEADGVIECWRDNKLLASVTNTKVRPKGFNNFFLQSDDASCLFSDVIVADYALTCDDHATADDEADHWQQPSLTENGTAGGDKMAVWASFDSDAYKAFKDGYTSYLNRFNTDEGINCWIPEEIHINHIALMSSDGYIPSHGIVYGSDDNKTWTQIGKWDEASSDSVVTASVNDEGHVYHYYSFHPTSGTDFHNGNADVTSISIMANLASKSKPSDVPKKTPTEDPHTVAFDTDVERNSEVSAETSADIQRTGELDLTPHDVSLKADIKRFAAGLVEAYADIKRKARDTERDITPRERELMTKVMTGDSLKKLFIYLRDFFTAPKAKCDEDGNSIKNTYQKIDEKAKTAELADKAAIAEFCSGNALSADNAKKLSTRRAITLSGDIEGTASFDGSSDITINTVAKISTDKVDKLQKDMTSGFAQTDMNLVNLKTELQNETDTKVSSAVTTTKNDFDAKIENTKSELSNNLSETVAKNVDAYHASIFRQPSTAYSVGDVVYVKGAGAKYYLLCTTAGTTGSGGITLPNPLVEKATIADGAVVWKVRKIGSEVVMPIGGILPFAGNGAVPAGYLLCDGAAVSRTMYHDLFSVIGITYGAGDGSTTFNVPDYNTAKRFAQGDTVAGTVKQAGLPNITGEYGLLLQTRNVGAAPSGALYTISEYKSSSEIGYGDNNDWLDTVGFDASRSSSIYGNSDTVQPNALTCRYIIKYK